MKLFTALALFFVILQSEECKKGGDSVRIPSCIQDKIAAIMQQPKYSPPATVYRYIYNDQYVYLISSNCCDQFNYLYDNKCNTICAPTGGITGKGDGRCPNFRQMASNETLIWKDNR